MAYGYAGPTCHCLVPPRVQRRADENYQGFPQRQYPEPNSYPDDVARDWKRERDQFEVDNRLLKSEIETLRDSVRKAIAQIDELIKQLKENK